MMAIYDYQCECGHRVEINHPMQESPQVICPKCVKTMRKGFGTPLLNFNGSGFYSTDKKNDR